MVFGIAGDFVESGPQFFMDAADAGRPDGGPPSL